MITHARVLPSNGFGNKAKVLVRINDAEEQELFSFYDDELSFSSKEFIGLTEDEGRQLFIKKDVAYLQS